MSCNHSVWIYLLYCNCFLLNYLDVKIFGVVKSALRALIHRWHSNNPGKVLNKSTVITEVARPAFESALSRKETTIKAFEMTGIYPFNPEAPDKTKLKAGEIFQQQKSEETVVLAETVVSVAPASAVPEEAALIASEENNEANVSIDLVEIQLKS